MQFQDLTIRMNRKPLMSGTCQIRFEIIDKIGDNQVGYLLAEPGESPDLIMKRIYDQVLADCEQDQYYQGLLHSVALGRKRVEDALIFEKNDAFNRL